MRFRGAPFDMDGLLLDTERLHLEAGTAAAAELGLEDLSATLRSMIGVRSIEGRARLEPAPRGRATAEAALDEANLRGFFRTLTCGDDVVRAKPDPEIYLEAAASLGIRPADAVAFEDSEPGTRAAVASGATVVQVPDLVAPSDALRILGHVVAPDVLSGTRRVGLIP